jgi:hypothetical protein
MKPAIAGGHMDVIGPAFGCNWFKALYVFVQHMEYVFWEIQQTMTWQTILQLIFSVQRLQLCATYGFRPYASIVLPIWLLPKQQLA